MRRVGTLEFTLKGQPLKLTAFVEVGAPDVIGSHAGVERLVFREHQLDGDEGRIITHGSLGGERDAHFVSLINASTRDETVEPGSIVERSRTGPKKQVEERRPLLLPCLRAVRPWATG